MHFLPHGMLVWHAHVLTETSSTAACAGLQISPDRREPSRSDQQPVGWCAAGGGGWRAAVGLCPGKHTGHPTSLNWDPSLRTSNDTRLVLVIVLVLVLVVLVHFRLVLMLFISDWRPPLLLVFNKGDLHPVLLAAEAPGHSRHQRPAPASGELCWQASRQSQPAWQVSSDKKPLFFFFFHRASFLKESAVGVPVWWWTGWTEPAGSPIASCLTQKMLRMAEKV